MSDIFETTEYIVKGNPDTAETPPSPGGGFDPDSLSASTNTPADADLIITKESNTWVKKTFAKVWDYIKSKIGINNSQGSANKFLNEQGTFTTVNSGKEYDLEFNNDLDEVTLTEDNVDKTTLPLVAEYVGTRADWNLLSAAEQAQYRIVHFIGEGGTADASDHTVAYTSSDVADGSATSWTSVTPITSGLSLSTLFARVSQMFKNVRYLYNQVTNINESLTKNNLPTATELTYNVEYECQGDGYLIVEPNAQVYVYGNDKQHYFGIPSTIENRRNLLYIKKGMVLKKQNNNTNKVTFSPLY